MHVKINRITKENNEWKIMDGEGISETTNGTWFYN